MVASVDTWSLVVHSDVREWLDEIRKVDRATAALTAQAITQVLEGAGPDERRPLVDRIKGSRIRELRELRPATVGSAEVRLLFAFDPWRRMVVLVAGARPGGWAKWHRDAVPLAEARFQDYLDSTPGDE